MTQALNESGMASGAAIPSMSSQPSETSGASLFVMGSVLLGTIGIFVTQAGAHPVTATWFRCASGLLGLSIWLAWRKALPALRLSRADAIPVLSAATLMVLSWVLFFAAIELTSAGVASVLFHVQPLWILVLAACFLKEGIAKRRAWAVLAAMAGLVLATGAADKFAAASPAGSNAGYWLGVGLCLFGALCTASVTLIAMRLKDVRTGVLAWWQCAIGTAVLLAWPVIHGWPAAGPAWGWLAGLGVIHTGLAYSLMYTGMTRLNTDRIAVLQFIYPGLVLILDWVVYGYRLGGLQIAGVVMLAGAVYAAERPARTA
ncbi:MAG: DMT family transporter [Polaromonas sp.]|uniref:DMT family transporter n=1 Tax=Polaromonas sp. TaxID=1869339 RepID=UPI0027319C94|nr:DMT family transporter [Polaromonas sp.]MDP1742873.1 DMT family transporter [Polaromonas sp.]MDP3355639.1 DMT family transporter [Polaromonas sp.]